MPGMGSPSNAACSQPHIRPNTHFCRSAQSTNLRTTFEPGTPEGGTSERDEETYVPFTMLPKLSVDVRQCRLVCQSRFESSGRRGSDRRVPHSAPRSSTCTKLTAREREREHCSWRAHRCNEAEDSPTTTLCAASPMNDPPAASRMRLGQRRHGD